jgi:coenzyme F420-0:L-glutamate ligase/coenzyme F420-1:gamma-L-glutamate ligase
VPAAQISISPVRGVKRVEAGDDIGSLLLEAMGRQGFSLSAHDIVVVTQKVVSKSEGRVVKLEDVIPSSKASSIAAELGKDARVVELVLRESKRIVRKGHGILITETKQGFVCANAGIDLSNVESGSAVLLPLEPDASAARIRRSLEAATKKELAVIITDTFGRPWREGQTDVAIGCSGISPTQNLSGVRDPFGYLLKVTQPAIADEVAAASELVMGKLSLVPAAVVRGVEYERSEAGVKSMLLDGSLDLFR